MLKLKDLSHAHTLRPYERNGQIVINSYLIGKFMNRSPKFVQNEILNYLNWKDHLAQNTTGFDRKIQNENFYAETFENKIWSEINEVAFRTIFGERYRSEWLNSRLLLIFEEFEKLNTSSQDAK